MLNLQNKISIMLCFPNAKINIGLNVVERRTDGFHNIETIFYPISLSDILEIIVNEKPADSKYELTITGQPIPGELESNLCVKAYQLLDKTFDLPPVKIYLHKLIPMGAGLGGGSSDGAYTLTLLNKQFELGLSNLQLVDYAAQLGSDCAFFIENRPAFGTEKGNVLKKQLVNLAGNYLVLVKPPVSVGTAEAYAGIQPIKPVTSVNQLITLPLNQWKNQIVNDFEKSVFAKHPEIKSVKDKLYASGAIYASMTGSGSALYGIFGQEVNLKANFEGMFYWGGIL
jgi:4-diphosphocytidyl-2-C-methyl-D-erythritol kinase